MQRDEREYEGYTDDVQNAGLCAREHEGSHMGIEERRLFGLNDEVLRRREEMTRLKEE